MYRLGVLEYAVHICFFFFFQAEDGIRDYKVTGVQTCALPICCSGCHLQPEVGGTSPFVNPQVAFANKMNATNTVPSFITANGPVREARFVRNPDGTPDGGVHALFTITGRDDAPGCVLGQPAFEQELANRNVIFRIPTPTYGAGLIEEIPDSAIVG